MFAGNARLIEHLRELEDRLNAADAYQSLATVLGAQRDPRAIDALRVAAGIEYFARPESRAGFGVFNGQSHRRQMFLEIVRAIPPATIVETGTFRGTTTEFFAEILEATGGTVFTCEIDTFLSCYSQIRLRAFSCVEVFNLDSREFLKQLVAARMITEGVVFCYLDAHWDSDLPLLDELEILLAESEDPVIMIDDFAVPGDAGYGHDEYGAGRVLSLDYIRPLDRPELGYFFPSLAAAEETGTKRGSVVIAKTARSVARLAALPSLLQYRR
jgi:predicted O-methyltransferase YrrM